MKRSLRWAGSLVAASTVAAVVSGGVATAAGLRPGNPHVAPQRGAQLSSNTNLADHGGPVEAASKSYAIWWGTQSAFPSDAKTGLDDLLSGLNGSTYLGIAGQYMRGAAVSTAKVADWTDTSSAPPTRNPATSTILSEVARAIAANGASPDPSATYFVYTSNFPGGHVNYCAWHSYGSVNGVVVQFAYMPNTTGIAGCDPGNTYDKTGFSQGTRSLANVTAHEFMEAITDPHLSAWYDASGQEIGDKCAWKFSATVNLGGKGWQLQQEWSNAQSGCAQG